MPLGLLVLALGAAWVLGQGWWRLNAPALLPPPSARDRVVVLGDGVARGAVGVDWITRFNDAQSRVVLLNHGRSFAECSALLEPLEQSLTSGADRVLIVAGTQEILAMAQGDPEARSRLSQGCEALCRALQRRGISAAWATPPLLGERATGPLYDALLSAAEVIGGHAQTYGLKVLPLHTRLRDHLGSVVSGAPTQVNPGRVAALRLAVAQSLLGRDPDAIAWGDGWRVTTDGLHLNSRGSELLMELVQGWLEEH